MPILISFNPAFFLLLDYLLKFISSSSHHEAFFRIDWFLNISQNRYLSRHWLYNGFSISDYRFSIVK